jgi:hypothetical protein
VLWTLIPEPLFLWTVQAELSLNNVFNVDALTKQSAYMLQTARERAGLKPFAVTTSAEAA